MTSKWAKRKAQIDITRNKLVVPFDKQGNQLFHPEETHSFDNGKFVLSRKYEWREVYVFWDMLKLVSCIKGSSAVYFKLQSTQTEKFYMMFLRDFVRLVKTRDMTQGMVEGKWTFVKRGEYYGIQACEEHEAISGTC